uniref:Glucose-methanol-choline oxidoreductase N-terminal domain-containing protein n=1 Tax=Clastoptera arizonana TaxID=38151 RepID=A0A1B6DCP1_9HEMI
MLIRSIFLLLSIYVLFTPLSSQSWNLLQSIIKAYKRQGLLFKENKYIGNRPILREYDFIVIGAGAAGSVVANRLTERPEWSVLLLEAGVDDNYYTDVPILSTYLWWTQYNWLYQTERQEGACLGLKDETCPWPSGTGVGGGTIINAMIYTRGNRRDFDGWAALGNEGWSYDDLLPYFKKSERVTIPDLTKSVYHGTKGNVFVEYPAYRSPLLSAFLDAGKEMGYNIVDYNDPNTHVGFSPIQATVRKGKRFGASKAYLLPIRERKNFHISVESQVTKILIDPVTKRAYGVEFIKRGRRRVVYARKEIILSAGAFNTPQLLMLSGIGPREHLEDIGIPVIQDLRVGENLQEHISMAGLSFLVNKPVAIVVRRIIGDLPGNFFDYHFRGKGVLTSLGCEGLGYIKTKYANYTDDLPDIEYIFVPISLASDGGSSLRGTMEITDEIFDAVYRNISHRDSWTIWPMILYPKSRGKVTLHSSNPTTPPKINANFLADKRDLDVIVEGLKSAVELSKTKAFQKYGSKLHTVPVPQCAHHQFGSDEYWGCTLKHITTQFHHQCCTAKMGHPSDPDAVVDNQLRVYGVTGLRVADCSIMPTITGGHTMAPAYVIGEKMGDLIKETWLSPGRV